MNPVNKRGGPCSSLKAPVDLTFSSKKAGDAGRKRHRDAAGKPVGHMAVKRAKTEKTSFEPDSDIYNRFYKSLSKFCLQDTFKKQVGKFETCSGSDEHYVKAFMESYNITQLKIGSILKAGGAFGINALEHYAVYIGFGKIVHFTGGTAENIGGEIKIENLIRYPQLMAAASGKLARPVNSGTARTVNVVDNCFMREHPNLKPVEDPALLKIEVENPPDALSGVRVLGKVLQHVGETDYNIKNKNCEHLARGIATGKYTSTQSAKIERYAQEIERCLIPGFAVFANDICNGVCKAVQGLNKAKKGTGEGDLKKVVSGAGEVMEGVGEAVSAGKKLAGRTCIIQ